VLIKQESQKMDTFAFALQQVLLNDRFSGETMTRDSKIKGANEEGKEKRKQQKPNSDFSLNFFFSASIFYPKSDFSFQHLDDELQKVRVQQ
jgi:hypothetical protein